MNRLDLLLEIIRLRGMTRYLEIGCRNDSVFAHIPVMTRVGVDPVSGGTHRMTSDEFFTNHRSHFDLVFIDGLHTHEQSLRDVANALCSLSGSDSVIVMHDCNPSTREMQIVPAVQTEWTGDVWRTLVQLRAMPNVDVATGDFDYGCGVILPQRNRSRLRRAPRTYEELAQNRVEALNLKSPEALLDWLGCGPGSRRTLHAVGGVLNTPATPPRSEAIYPSEDLKVGVVISTYGSTPYVHLGLEMLQRHCPGVPVLVHDDHSDNESLVEVCAAYGADVVSNPDRLGFPLGDLSSFSDGLRWSFEKGIDILVKFSRRFIPTYDWVTPLRALAFRTQCPTFCSVCRNLNWGFRSECVGMAVRPWVECGTIPRIEAECRVTDRVIFVEGFVHSLARDVLHASTASDVRRYISENPMLDACDGYAPWGSMMGGNRTVKVAGLLWHHSCAPHEYFDAAQRIGLTYKLEDFNSPMDCLGQ